MRRTLIAILAVVAVMASMASVASAASPHFVRQVQFTDLGTTLRATGSIAGLGNANIDVILTAEGTASITCTNPGGNVAPGQDTSVSVTGSQSDIQVKNGRASFDVTTLEPAAPADACPNAQWTPTVVDVQFTSATITVIQPAGSGIVVLERSFTF